MGTQNYSIVVTALSRINDVSPRPTRLVLRWLTDWPFAGIPTWYVTSRSGQLSLLTSAGLETSTDQGAVAVFCGREVIVTSGVAPARRHRSCRIWSTTASERRWVCSTYNTLLCGSLAFTGREHGCPSRLSFWTLVSAVHTTREHGRCWRAMSTPERMSMALTIWHPSRLHWSVLQSWGQIPLRYSGRRQVRSWLQTCSELEFGLSS